jgi:alpha-1,3-rhamnosyl/mannosyltransferase
MTTSRGGSLAPPRVLIDATPLRGASVVHGIGRYTYDLLHGLAETRGEWQSELTIEALADFGWVKSAAVSTDFAAIADGARAERDREWSILTRRWLMLGRAVLERRADLVHVSEARGMPLVLPTRSVVTCYDLIPLLYPREYLSSDASHFWRWTRDWHRYRMPTRIVAISARSGSDLALLRVPRERIDVVPTGINLALWSADPAPDDEARRASHGVAKTRYLIYVGYCDYRKNIRSMLEALGRARKEMPLELVWAGFLPPKKLEATKALARDMGLEDAVRFVGYVADPDLASLYRGAVGLIFLSRVEGFGLPVAEAMATGCPTIVARGSGSDGVAGDAGILVDPDDVSGASDAILRLARSEDLRADLARRGLRQVLRFDRREMARGYVKSYLRALGSGAA